MRRSGLRGGLAAVLTVVGLLIVACGSPPIQHAAASAFPPSGVTTPAQVFGPACDSAGSALSRASLPALSRRPLAEVVAAIPQLSTFANSIGSAQLVTSLDNHQETVFAPTDSAFARLDRRVGARSVSEVFDPPSILATVINYHVLPERFDARALAARATVHPRSGGTLDIRRVGSTITVAGQSGGPATVVCGDIPTANATLFMINKVLMPHGIFLPDAGPNCIGVTDPLITRCASAAPSGRVSPGADSRKGRWSGRGR